MDKNDETLDRDLDRAIEAIGRETVDPAVLDEAASRVWERLAREPEEIRSCRDFQELIPAYLKGELSRGRALLLEDHTRECIPCRRALGAARSGRVAAAAPAPARRWSAGRWTWQWAAAAAILVAAALVVKQSMRDAPGAIRIAEVEGSLYQVAEGGTAAVAPGTLLERGERVRTAKGSFAVVELADGSRVEMNERSELRVTRRGTDATIHLARGSVIVQASEQGSGHLYVRTGDCQVSVTGTVFSVVHGDRGSRISVLAGEVHVDDDREVRVLGPGDQVTTGPALGPIPIAEEIAWSRDLDSHLGLLKELAQLQREMGEALPMPGMRHSTRLLDSAPEGTVLYVGLPNLAETLSDAHDLLREKVATSPALGAWWQEHVVATGAEPKLARAIEEIRLFGGQLGDEIVLTLQKDADGGPKGPVFLAELRRPEELRALVASGQERPIRLIEEPGLVPPSADHGELLLLIRGDLLVAATNALDLRRAAGGGSFAGSSFHHGLAEAYRDGVSILFGADLEALVGDDVDHPLEGVRHLIVERYDEDDRTVTRAALSFSEKRTGIASWLAEPAPMGTLGFISADAAAAAAFVVRTPAALLSELLAQGNQDLRDQIAKFESEHGIDLLRDIAGPLGGEVALALDGPVLPSPAWKLVLEVYDQARLQSTVEWAVREVNEALRKEGREELALAEEQAGGRTYYRLSSGSLGTSLHYTFVDGYVVVAPERALLDRAIQHRDAGTTLTTAAAFTSLLPRDGRAHFSALAYHNLGPLVDSVLRGGIARSAPLSAEQRSALEEVARGVRPSLFYAYAERDRILAGGSDRAGLLGVNLGGGLGLGAILNVEEALQQAARERPGAYDGPGS